MMLIETFKSSLIQQGIMILYNLPNFHVHMFTACAVVAITNSSKVLFYVSDHFSMILSS